MYENICGRYTLQFNITIPKRYQIENFILQNIIVNNWIQIVRNYVWEWDFFNYNNDVNLDLYHILKIRYPVIKKIHQLFSLNALKWIKKDANGFCVSILLKNVLLHLGFIGKLHNDEFLIDIFTGKFQNGTPIIFNKTLYHCWYK